ncbi:MAG: PfkB family carbohydrate kinase [Pseudomonadota bacterium]|jgi:sugar/nucleoside kinase (ribokinase family)|nr:hypothetical protein [Alphaproteobacteria bacterium]
MRGLTGAGVTLIGPVSQDIVRVPGREARAQPGGAVYYAGMALRGFGLPVEIITRLAKADREHLTRELRAAGAIVNVSPSAQTTGFINEYSEDKARRAQTVDGRAAPIRMDDLPPLRTRWVYLGPLLQGDISADLISHIAAQRRHRIALDVQGFVRRASGGKVLAADWPGKTSFLPCIDILKADDAEAALLTGQTDREAAARHLSGQGIEHVVITSGGSGALICHRGVFHHVSIRLASGEAWPISDTTGCGDTFLAVYLAGVMSGEPPFAAGRLAAAAAALKARDFGPLRAGWEDVRELASRLQSS